MTPRGGRCALVLSGGGANGAYEVGVVKALLAGLSPATAGRPLVPDTVAGTSIGSFNAAFLVARWDARGSTAASDLEAVWLDRLARQPGRTHNGAFRFRGDPLDFLDPSSYVPNPWRPFVQLARDGVSLAWEGAQRTVALVTEQEAGLRQRLVELVDVSALLSVAPWRQTIRDTIDFAAVRAASRLLRVAATNWTTGELRIFTNADMTERLGPLAIEASSAIPGIFPPVAVGAEPHVDGGVLMNTPLKLGLETGAEELHVVYLDPDVKSIPFSALRSTVGSSYRQQTIAWARAVNDDIEDARVINRGLELIARLERNEEIDDASLALVAKSVHKIWGRMKQFLRYKLLTVHRYHPRDDLSGGALGLLNLDREHVKELIDRGFADAAAHDCLASGCVLPSADGEAVA